MGKANLSEIDPSPNHKLSDGSQSSETSPKPEIAGDIVRLLIKEGHVSSSQVSYACKVQERLDIPRRLLEILKELGYIREEQIKETLFKNRTAIRLGTLLVELGHISEKQLTIALNKQEQGKDKKRLGKILMENNYILS